MNTNENKIVPRNNLLTCFLRNPQSAIRNSPAFTLIELLVVIAIIGVLAALLIPTVGAVKATQLKKRAQTELTQVETAIESYKADYGFYPPGNSQVPANPLVNQLYYELEGTITNLIGGKVVYQTLDSSAQISTTDLSTVFGSGVGGFLNCTKSADEDSKPAKCFLPDLKPNQVATANINGVDVKLLVCTVNDPNYKPLGQLDVNPWRYNPSNPTNNPGSYDLWVDILVRGKTNRISNWSTQPQIVP